MKKRRLSVCSKGDILLMGWLLKVDLYGFKRGSIELLHLCLKSSSISCWLIIFYLLMIMSLIIHTFEGNILLLITRSLIAPSVMLV